MRISPVTDRAAETLSDTVTPQGLVAVCDLLDVPVRAALAGPPALVAVLVGVADPGNAGTVIRVADAAGAGAVLLAGDTVDPHNGKAVRASTGSVFHLPLARDRDAAACSTPAGSPDSPCWPPTGVASWICTTPTCPRSWPGPPRGSSAARRTGSRAELAAAADHRVRVPIHGRAESLNLATAAAVCLYASAQHRARVG